MRGVQAAAQLTQQGARAREPGRRPRERYGGARAGPPLTAGFQQAYNRTLPTIDALEQTPPESSAAEALLMQLRDGLTEMEERTSEMMGMLYEVDVYMAPSAAQSAAGFNPQEALSHVSDVFHVRGRSAWRR